MIIRICSILVLIFLLTDYSAAQQTSTEPDTLSSRVFPQIPFEALEDALMGIKCTPSDISLRTDYADPDSFRLPIVDSLTLNPLGMIPFSDTLSAELIAQREELFQVLAGFREAGFVNLSPYRFPKEFPREVSASRSAEGGSGLVSFREELRFLRMEDDDDFRDLLNTVISELIEVRSMGDRALRGLPDAHRAFIRDTLPRLILEEEGLEDAPVEVLDSIQQYEDSLMERFVGMAEQLIMDSDYRTIRPYVDAESFRRMMFLTNLLSDSLPKLVDSVDFSFTLETDAGRISIGGYGENTFNGSFALIVDLGGDDRYDLGRFDGPQVVIDISGDDFYAGKEDFAIASGFFYPAVLVDNTGNDSYQAYSFSLGSGLFSVGVLIDRAGDDFYVGDTHTQGAGTFGIGALFDYGGIDSYRCALFGQAFAGVRGLGVLTDGGGNDIYFAGGKYTDVLRYQDHYISLSQGFAYGWRPDMSGGVAILADSSGHDTYLSDIFGQGSSYWYALGMQTDFGGNDKYISYQYAQGVGTHLCLGILMDKSGDDYYFAKGVSQGCGHDLAAGILIDYSGSDNYQAWDLSQGAGSANGIGIIIDYLGNDNYQIKGKHNTQGYGNPRRDYGSLGIFLDLMGKDEYIGNGSDTAYWIINSKWGVGVDRDFWPKPDTLETEK